MASAVTNVIPSCLRCLQTRCKHPGHHQTSQDGTPEEFFFAYRLTENGVVSDGRPRCCCYTSPMKAAVRTRYGPPEVVRIAEVDQPAVTDHEVLVKVHVTTVNRTDCGFRAAKPFIVRFFSGLIRPRVTVLGSEFAGVVEAVGRGVTSVEVGDRVFGYNEGRFGAHAEYLSIPEDGP